MLQQDKPEDFVLGTGETHSVKEFVERAFARAGLDYKQHVIIDPALFRPAEVDILKADYSKAKEKLGWEPKKKFAELVDWMVDEDIRKEEQSV
jgi:GDPmannose 4,6-dehydratase